MALFVLYRSPSRELAIAVQKKYEPATDKAGMRMCQRSRMHTKPGKCGLIVTSVGVQRSRAV